MLNWHNSPVFDGGKSLSQWRVPNWILHSTAEYTFMAVCQPRDQPCDVSLPSFSTALTVSPVIISSSPAVKILRSNSAKAYSLPTCSNGKHTCGQNCRLTTTWVALASIPDFTRLPCLVDCWRWSLTAYLGSVSESETKFKSRSKVQCGDPPRHFDANRQCWQSRLCWHQPEAVDDAKLQSLL